MAENKKTKTQERPLSPRIEGVYRVLKEGMVKIMGANPRDLQAFIDVVRGVYADAFTEWLGGSFCRENAEILTEKEFRDKIFQASQQYMQDPSTNMGVWDELNQYFLENYANKLYKGAIKENGTKLEGKEMELFKKETENLEQRLLMGKLREQFMGKLYPTPANRGGL